MRSYAVIPPLMLDSEQKRYPFINENGLLGDIVADAKVRTGGVTQSVVDLNVHFRCRIEST